MCSYCRKQTLIYMGTLCKDCYMDAVEEFPSGMWYPEITAKMENPLNRAEEIASDVECAINVLRDARSVVPATDGAGADLIDQAVCHCVAALGYFNKRSEKKR